MVIDRAELSRRTQGILRGRSERVVERVLDAALAELAHSGYARFRMQIVASRAGVNKTTIYRRWPNRAALVGALVSHMKRPLQETPLPDTGTLEDDLVQAFTRRFTLARTTSGRAWSRLLEERRQPEVEAIIGKAVDERRDEWRAMVIRGIARGELPRRTDPQLVLDFVRAIADAPIASGRFDAARLSTAIRTVLAGAQSGTLVPGAATPSRARR